MADGWLCDACRSLNKSRDKRCYSCRVPRRGVEHQQGTAGIARGVSADTPTPLALAVRGGARYRPSWLLAAVIIPLIVIVAILDAMLWPAVIAMLRVDGSFAGNPATTPIWGRFAIEMGAMVAAGFLWSVWMAVCLGNIPALTGRWPGFGTSDAMLAPLGRRSGYYRPMHVVREVVDHFAGGRIWPNLLVTAWWAAWLASIVVPGAIAAFRYFVFGVPLRDMLGTLLLRPYLVAIAAVLAIGVVVVVEWLQHQARRGLTLTLDAGLPPPADPVQGRRERGATVTAVVMMVAGHRGDRRGRARGDRGPACTPVGRWRPRDGLRSHPDPRHQPGGPDTDPIQRSRGASGHRPHARVHARPRAQRALADAHGDRGR